MKNPANFTLGYMALTALSLVPYILVTEFFIDAVTFSTAARVHHPMIIATLGTACLLTGLAFFLRHSFIGPFKGGFERWVQKMGLSHEVSHPLFTAYLSALLTTFTQMGALILLFIGDYSALFNQLQFIVVLSVVGHIYQIVRLRKMVACENVPSSGIAV